MKIDSPYPIISCICLTRGRTELLLRTIKSFSEQTYPYKELIISYSENDANCKTIIDKIIEHEELNIIPLKRNNVDSVGKARNNATIHATGKYICIFDDDDLHYHTRLSEQYYALREQENSFDASILNRIILYHSFEDTAYLSFPTYWSGTLLCLRDHLLSHPCGDTNEFEYTDLIDFLQSNQMLQNIAFSPFLYTFIFNGSNMMKYKTFLELINRSEKIDPEISKNIKTYIEQSYISF